MTLAANFFKISLNFDVACEMQRTRRDVTQVQGMQQLTDCPLMVSNLVFRFDPPLNIHTAPTDKTIFLWIRGLQYMCLHGRLLLSRQPLLWMTARRIAQTFWSLRVETVHPITQGLASIPLRAAASFRLATSKTAAIAVRRKATRPLFSRRASLRKSPALKSSRIAIDPCMRRSKQ